MAPLRQHFGRMPLPEIRTADVEDFVAKLKEPAVLASIHKVPRVRRPATINRYLSLLRHMFNWAVGREYLDRTPLRLICSRSWSSPSMQDFAEARCWP